MATATQKPGSKAEQTAAEIARVADAGKSVSVETVDFGDPGRPKTCLEVDFPILPINQIAIIEGNAGKPIYQMSKWWARRRSSVFRSLMLAASMKAPEDSSKAAKAVWDVYYGNHQKKGALKHLKVADIFMGGGTTIVEGSRLGLQMFGTDLNPVAWFVVKNEIARVDPEKVQALLNEIEAEVKPQIIPFYACHCPRGHRGKWTQKLSGKVMGDDFDPLSLSIIDRNDYSYEGPEIIYVFWAKHGPCQVTGCGHRTPVMSSPVIAVKSISVKAMPNHRCPKCHEHFDIEEGDVRMAPGVPLVIGDPKDKYAIFDKEKGVACPYCGFAELVKFSKAVKKKIDLTLLVHPEWLAGSPKLDPNGKEYGGSVTDDPESTAAWNQERAKHLRLIEVRGPLNETITCPETGISLSTSKGTVPTKSHFACGNCGKTGDVLESVKASGKTGPVSAYAIQGYCPTCNREERPYGGRFFATVTNTRLFDVAANEWAQRKDSDLADYWPRTELPYGFMTHHLQGGVPNHGFTHWWKMFNTRQLLVHAQLLKAIWITFEVSFSRETREFVLGAFQQYLRNQSMFTLWNVGADKLEPMFANNNYHPKSTVVENGVFSALGRGNWASCSSGLLESLEWSKDPWELASNEWLIHEAPQLQALVSGKSEKIKCNDPVGSGANLQCLSATELSAIQTGSYDLVITDPPFGGLLHYSELSDFFYVWLRLVLKECYPEQFGPEYTPKALEAVSNRARQPEDPEGFYQRLLTECWRESHRILKPAGILAFTFHHSEDEPWVAVLESLFDAGFWLEATYPIRSDETKGEGEFGSKKVEYDIIHVCRKRTQEPTRVSWGRMRREVIEEVRQIQSLLEHHAKEGLPAADLQVIKRGKALEYFSRHYGKVFVDEAKTLSVKDALAGINLILDEESGRIKEPPPVMAEPFTRQLLRIFDGHSEQPRDQIQKFLRGTGIAPEEFEQRGWCNEDKKVLHLIPPLEIAKSWYGRPRRNMTSDYDQAMFLIGACFDGSGINAMETINNQNFRPHPALAALLEWHSRRAAGQSVRNASMRALAILNEWERTHQDQVRQLKLEYGE